MPFPIICPCATPSSEYRIYNSLRFTSANLNYLSRGILIDGDRKTWTWSGWIKRSSTGVASTLFSAGSFFVGFDIEDKLLVHYNGNDLRKIYQPFKDVNSWYHIVIVLDTTTSGSAGLDRCRTYVNGIDIIDYETSANITLNASYPINDNTTHEIGRETGGTNYFNGYMTDIVFVDGLALEPSSFAENNRYGVWSPKRYTGSYGGKGYHLSLYNSTSTITLGYDDAGGEIGQHTGTNDWTLNNFTVANDIDGDVFVDVPTNWGEDTGVGGEVRGNYPILSNLSPEKSTISWGGLSHQTNVAETSTATMGVMTGKWYWEWYAASSNMNMGISNNHNVRLSDGTNSACEMRLNNIFPENNCTLDSETFASVSAGDIFGWAFDADAGTCVVYQNGTQVAAWSAITLEGPYFPCVDRATTGGTPVHHFNGGQRPFIYSPPANHKAICSTNLPALTIDIPKNYFNVVKYIGSNTIVDITGVGFQPNTTIIQQSNGSSWFDSIRGGTKVLQSNSTIDQITESGLTAFISDGFTLGATASTGYNNLGATYVSYNWKSGANPGFDIVQYTGNGSNRTISHNLNAVPKFMIIKAITTAGANTGWAVYHSKNTTAPETDYLLINSTADTVDDATVWNDTAPTSSVFSVGTNSLVNTNGDTYIAYLWSEVEGFSKFLSYTGNGSTDGPFVYCGFNPQLLIIKGGTNGWFVFDVDRKATPSEYGYDPFTLAGGGSYSDYSLLMTANGFKIIGTDASINTNATNYKVAAFSEFPFKHSLSR